MSASTKAKQKIKKPLAEPQRTAKQKMGFISTIMLVIGSSVGAGIFIKNWNILTNVQFALFYAILSWMIAIIGIFALALALIEICSGSSKANSQGIIGWVREFNGKFLYRVSKNFMAFLHIPIIYVMMPVYMIMVSQQAFGYQMTWWGCALITLGLGMYHIWFVGFFSKVANISNWIVSSIEFLPLIFACISGFIVLATNGLYDGAHWFTPDTSGNSTITSFAQFSLVCGVLNSIPAVFFSFDGFYSAAGLQTEMREPKKMSKALTIGVAIVAAFEIFVSISLLIGCKDGSLFGLNPENSPFPMILVQFMMVCVFIGMLSVITGSAVYAPRFYESLIAHDEMPFGKRFKNRLSTDKPIVGSVYATILFMVVFLITFGVGPWFWDIGGYTSMTSITGVAIYKDSSMANVLSFVDTYGNWNALFAFVCVTFAIFGALRNRKTKKVKVTKSKVFVPSALVAITIVGVGIIFVFINTFANLGINTSNLINGTGNQLDFLGALIAVAVLFAFIGVSAIPALIQTIKNHTLPNYLDDLHHWMARYVHNAKAKGVVVGISGGIDSAVVAAIANKRKDIKVLGVWMNIDNSPLDIKCVNDLKKQRRFPIINVDLMPIFNEYKKTLKIKDKLAIANLKARLRAVALYTIAQQNNLLVAGTGNADELYMGYFTKHGDGACDLLPIARLTKARVFEAASILNLPKSIIQRAPSASLYENQTDEGEMGISYKKIDAFLRGKRISPAASSIVKRYHRVNAHKLVMPVKPKRFEHIR